MDPGRQQLQDYINEYYQLKDKRVKLVHELDRVGEVMKKRLETISKVNKNSYCGFLASCKELDHFEHLGTFSVEEKYAKEKNKIMVEEKQRIHKEYVDFLIQEIGILNYVFLKLTL